MHRHIKIWDLAWILLAVILTLSAYWPALSAGFFCWDDKDVALAPLIRTLSWKQVLDFFISFHAGLYHPLTTLSFALDYYTGKGTPLPYHLTNILLHLFNTVMVFILARRLTRDVYIAVFASLLFGLTPMHVESVTWITSRKDVLYGFFFLASLLTYNEFSRGKEKKWIWYFFTLLLVLFSCLSKIQAAVLPFLFLLMDYHSGRKVFSSRNLFQKVPFLAIVIFFGIINIMAQKEIGYLDYRTGYSVLDRIFLFCYGFSQYFLRILFPVQVSVFYPFPFRPGEHDWLLALSSVLFILLFLFLGEWFLYKRKKDYAFGYLFFFICILIALAVSNLRETVIAARYTYIASAGLFIFLGEFFREITLKYRGATIWISIFCSAFILGSGVLTFLQNKLWRSPFKVIESASLQFPGSPVLLNTLASIDIDSANYKRAAYNAALAAGLDPGYAQAWYTLGLARNKVGEGETAIQDFSRAIRLNPRFYDAWFGRGIVFSELGDYSRALDDYTRVLVLKPDHTGAWNNRAIIRGNLGDFRGAMEDLDQAIRYNPRSGPSYYLRGIAKFECGLNGCRDLGTALSLGYTGAQKALDHYCR